MKIQIHKIIHDTTAEGFGRRTCIWVQGCSRRCKGCMAMETWKPDGGSSMDSHDVIDIIMKQKEIEGVTFLGGEPFEQAEALSEIAVACKTCGLSVISFSGFTLNELQSMENEGVKNLLAQIDLLIDGPYIQEKREFGRPWAGSSNQKFYFLTDRYTETMLQAQYNKVEIRIAPNGAILVNGMADFEKAYEEENNETI